jgi:hypothetical protein
MGVPAGWEDLINVSSGEPREGIDGGSTEEQTQRVRTPASAFQIVT